MAGACAGCGGEFTGAASAAAWTCASCGRVNAVEPGAAAPGSDVPAPGSIPAPPAVPEPARAVTEDRPCLRCGYSLKGLGSDGVCPECGASVARSLRGNLLEFAAPEYLGTLRTGALVAAVGLIASLLTGLPVAGLEIAAKFKVLSLSTTVLENVDRAADLGALLMVLGGWWLLSTPDPALVGHDGDAKLRRWLRVLLVGAVLSAAGALTYKLAPGVPQALGRARSLAQSDPLGAVASPVVIAVILGWILGVLITAAKFFVSVLYLASLAKRIPDAALESNLRVCLWLVPLLSTVGVVACGLGPLAASIIMIVMFFSFRKSMAALLERVRAETAGA